MFQDEALLLHRSILNQPAGPVSGQKLNNLRASRMLKIRHCRTRCDDSEDRRSLRNYMVRSLAGQTILASCPPFSLKCALTQLISFMEAPERIRRLFIM